jgi:Xaa-Pro aminopeptidase
MPAERMPFDDANPLPPLRVDGRLDRVRALLATAGGAGDPVDSLLVTAPSNVRWLTGFSGSAGVLLVTRETALLTTDGRYRSQSEEQLAAAGVSGEVDRAVGGVAAQREALAAALAGAGRLGLEADHVSWAAVRTWESVFTDAELCPTRGVVEGLRAVKDDGELARMARAADIADAALAAVLPLLTASARPGRRTTRPLTEAAFAAALDHAMRERGSEDRAFETIVASGENSAKPHARPGTREIGPGDPVVVDFGAVFDGYRSDMTRTFCVGGPPAGELAAVFDVVSASQRAGVDAVVAGVTADEVDRACREVIAASGWAERFEHGTGHGVGLDIHEDPPVGPGATAILAPGTVVTVEPGVYLPGTGGVRIEDTLVVTEHGSRSLTQFPKEVAV